MQAIPRHRILTGHLFSVTLAVALFTVHTLILFGMACCLKDLANVAGAVIHIKLVGPILILACFVALFITHLLEAAVWAAFFWHRRQFSSFGESYYFSVTSITALGYGDVTLRPPWRVLGSIMAVNGLLMFGCSSAFLFVVMQKIWADML